MDLNVAVAVGEIIGAIAVVISVVYMAIQIRKQTEEARLSAAALRFCRWEREKYGAGVSSSTCVVPLM
jgi:hypothetical protein